MIELFFYFVSAVADDNLVYLWFVAVFLVEEFFGLGDEAGQEFVFNKVDSATAEAAAHDTRTGYTAFLGNVVEVVEFFA